MKRVLCSSIGAGTRFPSVHRGRVPVYLPLPFFCKHGGNSMGLSPISFYATTSEPTKVADAGSRSKFPPPPPAVSCSVPLHPNALSSPLRHVIFSPLRQPKVFSLPPRWLENRCLERPVAPVLASTVTVLADHFFPLRRFPLSPSGNRQLIRVLPLSLLPQVVS